MLFTRCNPSGLGRNRLHQNLSRYYYAQGETLVVTGRANREKGLPLRHGRGTLMPRAKQPQK